MPALPARSPLEFHVTFGTSVTSIPRRTIRSTMPKLAVLYDAGQAVLSTFDLDEVLQRILAIARDYFHLPNVAILLLEQGSPAVVGPFADRLGCRQRQDLFGTTRRDHRSRGPEEATGLCPRREPKTHATSAPPNPRARNWPFRSWCAMKSWACSTARATASTVSTTKPSNCWLCFPRTLPSLCRMPICTRWNASGRGNWKPSTSSRNKAPPSWNWRICWSACAP